MMLFLDSIVRKVCSLKRKLGLFQQVLLLPLPLPLLLFNFALFPSCLRGINAPNEVHVFVDESVSQSMRTNFRRLTLNYLITIHRSI